MAPEAAANAPTPPSLEDTELAAVMEALPSPVLIVDPDHTIRWLNVAAEALLGLGRTQLIGHSLADLTGATHSLLSDVRRVAETGVSVTAYDVDLRAGDGTEAHTISVAAIAAKTGDTMVSLVLHPRPPDLASRDHHLAELAASAAEKVHDVLDSHLIRPVSALRGALQVMPGARSPDERAELWGIMGESSQTLMHFAKQVAGLGEQPAGQPEPVNLHTVIDAALAATSDVHPRNARIERVFDPSLPPARGWPDLLDHALQAVFANALDAVPAERGTLRVETRYRHDGPRFKLPNSGLLALPLQITVSDNGGGVDPDLEPIVFHPFVGNRDGHTGLGLTVAAHIISRHGGQITIAPKRSGTQVTIDLPRYFDREAS